MAVSYKKLWKLLIDKDMKKKELEQQAKVSHYTVSKMYRGEGDWALVSNVRVLKSCLVLI